MCVVVVCVGNGVEWKPMCGGGELSVRGTAGHCGFWGGGELTVVYSVGDAGCINRIPRKTYLSLDGALGSSEIGYRRYVVKTCPLVAIGGDESVACVDRPVNVCSINDGLIVITGVRCCEIVGQQGFESAGLVVEPNVAATDIEYLCSLVNAIVMVFGGTVTLDTDSRIRAPTIESACEVLAYCLSMNGGRVVRADDFPWVRVGKLYGEVDGVFGIPVASFPESDLCNGRQNVVVEHSPSNLVVVVVCPE